MRWPAATATLESRLAVFYKLKGRCRGGGGMGWFAKTYVFDVHRRIANSESDSECEGIATGAVNTDGCW